jgi:ABC transporter substrate binding protein (PQQ-dependent alcohol dehydrogenase system)
MIRLSAWPQTLGFFLTLFISASAQAAAFKVVLLVPQDDTRLERTRLERAYLGHTSGPAVDGVNAALNESKQELEGAGALLSVDVQRVASPQAAADAAKKAEQAGAAAVLTDLGLAATTAVADAVKLPVLNISETDDRLRQDSCRARLMHLAPSDRMRADALAQTLLARQWRSVLLLAGPSPRDAERAATALAAIKRYGLKLTQQKPFKLSADPRERDLANATLLTQGAHDVVWVVDSDGEFARSLPYRTATARPVVGDGGLVALAWHAQYDRYGATQVSRRFQRAAQRSMGANDWLAWMAGKALVAAALAAPQGPTAAFQKALVDGEIDGSKGVTMSFRPWDGQLRQPLLLTDGQGVIGTAPVEGVQHPKNNLDTLGADAPEKLCKARAT